MNKHLFTNIRNRNITLLAVWCLIGLSVVTGMSQLMLLGMLAANLYAFFLMAYDKRSARLGKSRIPENSLLLTAGLGGSLGALCGMILFRHKTRHAKFLLLVPLFTGLQIMALWATVEKNLY